MPLPRGLARLNRRVTNRMTTPFARQLPGFGVLHHVGRKTGEEYVTPLNAWKVEQGVVVALTYGPEVDWLKNARAAEEVTMVMGGMEIRLGRPAGMTTEAGLKSVPSVVRPVLKALGVGEFVRFPRID